MLGRSVPWGRRVAAVYREVRLATPEQQAWWDGLADDERVAFALLSHHEAPTEPREAAIRAQLLELQDRALLRVPTWLLGAGAALYTGLALTNLPTGFATASGLAGVAVPVFLVGAFRHRQRRIRWRRIDECRALAVSVGEPVLPVPSDGQSRGASMASAK